MSFVSNKKRKKKKFYLTKSIMYYIIVPKSVYCIFAAPILLNRIGRLGFLGSICISSNRKYNGSNKQPVGWKSHTRWKMKNRIFTALLVLSCILLAVVWNSRNSDRRRLNQIKSMFHALQTRIHMLELKAKALKVEMEMVKVSNHLIILKDREKRKKSRRKKWKEA